VTSGITNAAATTTFKHIVSATSKTGMPVERLQSRGCAYPKFTDALGASESIRRPGNCRDIATSLIDLCQGVFERNDLSATVY
jgi:hypothetical protein